MKNTAIMSIKTNLEFENAFPPQPFNVKGDAELIDSNGQPANIIKTDDNWSVRFQWTQDGPLIPFLASSNNWHLTIILEEMGKGETDLGTLGKKKVAFVNKTGHVYDKTITIPGGNLKPGLYRVVVCLTFTVKSGSPAAEIAAYGEFDLIKFYQAP